jgi:hypothetical protein
MQKNYVTSYWVIWRLSVAMSKVLWLPKIYMRNEIWSLVSYVRAPSWFVTLSPADNKHPICLYFADTDEEFKPDIRLPDDMFHLVASNPAAAA